MNRRTTARAGLALAMIVGVGCGESKPPAAPSVGPGEAMRDIFAQLEILLPAAVLGEFEDPERADEIGAAFDRMRSRSDALVEHGNGLDAGARLFGRALARDVRRAREFFYRGRYENAAIFVESLVDECMDCHTRVAADDSPLAQGFVEQAALQALDPLEQAAIAVATRRFDEGIERYEQVLRVPGGLADLLLEPIIRYLSVVLRVARDPGRARRLVAEYADHPDLGAVSRVDLEHWMQTLDGLAPGDFAGTTLIRARGATEAGDQVARYPGDPKALIEFLLASAQLQDLVARPQESPAAVAEIYELLGRSEVGIGHSVWLSRADLYWETAVRVAPQSPVARSAYGRLEAQMHESFTGPTGLQLPVEEEARLDELRALLEGQAGEPANEQELQEFGARLFAEHCVFCHGADAQGLAMGRAPLVSTEDLTRIASRRGGTFPEAEVFALIARRDPLGKHRSPEMPSWGEFWRDDSRIDALVVYLRSIQRR